MIAQRSLLVLDILRASLVFELLEYSPAEEAYIVWERILAGLSYIEQMIASTSSGLYLYERFRSYMVDLIVPIYNKLGWEDPSTSSSSDQWLDALHRDMIVSMACRFDLDHCTQRAQQLFEQWFNSPSNNSIAANQRRVVYCTSIRLGDRARFQFLLREYQASNDPQEKARIQTALTCTRDIDFIRYLLEIHISSDRNIIRRQDVLNGIRSICRNFIAETECWAFVRARWTQLFRDYGESLNFANLIKDVTERFNTELQLQEFERFFEQTTTKVCRKSCSPCLVSSSSLFFLFRARRKWNSKRRSNESARIFSGCRSPNLTWKNGFSIELWPFVFRWIGFLRPINLTSMFNFVRPIRTTPSPTRDSPVSLAFAFVVIGRRTNFAFT